MSRVKNWDRALAIVGIVIAIASLIWNWYQDQSAADLLYRVNSVSYRPRLWIDEVTLVPVKAAEIRVGGTNQRIPELGFGGVSVSVRYRVKNISAFPAEMIAQAWTDTVVGTPFLRDWLADEDHWGKIEQCTNTDFFGFRELLPDSSYRDAFDLPIQRVDEANHVLALHLMVLYRNELGQLFDTYYIGRFSTTAKIAVADVCNADRSLPPPDILLARIGTRYFASLEPRQTSVCYDRRRAKTISAFNEFGEKRRKRANH